MATTSQVYRIPVGNFFALEHRIELLNRRAHKLSVPEIVMTVAPEIIEERVYNPESEINLMAEATLMQRFQTVTITGVAPRLNGWTFLGTLQYVPELKTNLLHCVPGKAIPERYRRVQPSCDHCQLPRIRHDTFVVQNEAGETKQIGRNCLADFLGHKDPHALAAAAQILLLANEAAEMSEDEGWGEGSGRGNRFVVTEAYLGHVAAMIEAKGWLSRTKAVEMSKEYDATATRAFQNMFPPKNETEKPVAVEERHREQAAKALRWVRDELPEDPYNKAHGLSEYELNLMTACELDSFDERNTGLVASVMAAHNRALEQRVAREQQATSSSFVGTVKARQIFTLTLTRTTWIDGNWGRTALHKFLDESGNVIVWFATGGNTVEVGTEGVRAPLEIGKTYQIKGTIKKHEEYQGVKQTFLTRCKVQGTVENQEAK